MERALQVARKAGWLARRDGQLAIACTAHGLRSSGEPHRGEVGRDPKGGCKFNLKGDILFANNL